MKVEPTEISDVVVIEPKIFGDDRGFFYESFNRKTFADIVGIKDVFVQDNHSRSIKKTLRGLHYQLIQPQGKLVRVVLGEVYDVVVDIRKSSPTFGKSVGVHLSASNKKMLWVPKGFAHGFLVLSDVAEFVYKTTDFYHPASERTICWNDPDLHIEWPIVDGNPLLSLKDSQGVLLKEAEVFS